MSAGCTASLTLAAALHRSEATLRVKLSHTLPALRAVPPEALLTTQLGWESGRRLDLRLRAGACELQGSGELHLGPRLQWQVLAQSSCEALQVGGAAAWEEWTPGSRGVGQGLPPLSPPPLRAKQGRGNESQREGLIKYLSSPLCALEMWPRTQKR